MWLGKFSNFYEKRDKIFRRSCTLEVIVIDPIRRVIQRMDVSPPWSSPGPHSRFWVSVPITLQGGQKLELWVDARNVNRDNAGHFILGGIPFSGPCAMTGPGGTQCPNIPKNAIPDVQWISARYAKGLRMYMRDVEQARSMIRGILDFSGSPF
jgi:hypothetical protein